MNNHCQLIYLIDLTTVFINLFDIHLSPSCVLVLYSWVTDMCKSFFLLSRRAWPSGEIHNQSMVSDSGGLYIAVATKWMVQFRGSIREGDVDLQRFSVEKAK